MFTTTRRGMAAFTPLLMVALGSGCGETVTSAEVDVLTPQYLAAPQPISLGVQVVASDIVAARVATAAAMFRQPELWGVSVTGRELTLGAVFDAVVTRLDDPGVTSVVFVSANEAHFTVPWAGSNLPLGYLVEMCVQIVHFPGDGIRHFGPKDCAEYD